MARLDVSPSVHAQCLSTYTTHPPSPGVRRPWPRGPIRSPWRAAKAPQTSVRASALVPWLSVLSAAKSLSVLGSGHWTSHSHARDDGRRTSATTTAYGREKGWACAFAQRHERHADAPDMRSLAAGRPPAHTHTHSGPTRYAGQQGFSSCVCVSSRPGPSLSLSPG